MTTNNNKVLQERKPPYIAFKTFLTALETLQQALPPVIDRSVWHTFSGSLQSHTLGSFKYLELIDDDGNVLPLLERLVNTTGDERKQVLKEIIQDKYPTAIQLGLSNSSFQQLQDHFRSLGVQGRTLEMVIRFYMDACEFTKLQCSPFWAKAKKTAKRTPRKSTGNRGSVPPPKDEEQPKGSSSGQPQTIQLKSGGYVTISISIDPISLSRDDRKWLFELIDKFNTYGDSEIEDEVEPDDIPF